MQDMDKNNQSDYIDFLDKMQQTDEFQQTMSLSQNKENTRSQQFNQKQDIEKQKMDNQMAMKDKDLQIAQTNKNRFDKPKENAKKKK